MPVKGVYVQGRQGRGGGLKQVICPDGMSRGVYPKLYVLYLIPLLQGTGVSHSVTVQCPENLTDLLIS